MKLFLKGDRCFTDKCAYERRPYPPGQHGRGRHKMSDYAVQLREKQKVRRMYGVLEQQFRLYFAEADRAKGVTGTNLLAQLETRLDNVVFRMGFANSRDQARQLVRHGIFTLNGRKVDIPSMQVKVNDVVEIPEKNRKIPVIQEAQSVLARRGSPSWLEVDGAAFRGRITAIPNREDIQFPIQEQLIVELYSK
jgi:small subunit ribosomal protein S4